MMYERLACDEARVSKHLVYQKGTTSDTYNTGTYNHVS
jgi:hypothetical protein